MGKDSDSYVYAAVYKQNILMFKPGIISKVLNNNEALFFLIEGHLGKLTGFLDNPNL